MKVIDLVVTIIVTVLLISMTLCLFFRFPCNHAGSAYVYLPFFATALPYLVWRLRTRRISVKIGILVSVIGCLFVVSCDVFNMWISYDVWIDRGMPEFFTFGLPGHSQQPS